MILVDPPLNDVYYVDDRKDMVSKVQFCLKPFLGAYEDFMGPFPSSEGLDTPAMPRERGISYDLGQYWERSLPICFDPKDPTIQSLAYDPLRMIAAEWVRYVAVMHECLRGHEQKDDGDPALKEFDTRLQELQSWRRRTMLSQQKVRSVLRSLQSWMTKNPNDMSLLQPLAIDYEYISTNIEEFGRMLESSISVVTSVVQIVEARRSFNEASNIRRLTILALIFVPLSYVSSLFSMNSTNALGSPHFWVYFVVAIPVTLLVVMVARVPRLGSWNSVAWLKARRGGRREWPGLL